MAVLLSMDEVRQHCSRTSCWVVVNGMVYDMTAFLDDHPGGAGEILRYAGGDGSLPFNQLHSPDFLNTLEAGACLGPVDTAGITDADRRVDTTAIRDPTDDDDDDSGVSLGQMMNVYDFEEVAQRKMSPDGWAYYSSGADDEVTLRENHMAFQRIWFRPRVMVNVRTVSTHSRILGYDTAFPVYISATALGRLAHPEGEVVLTRAAHHAGIVQMCPTLASCTIDELTAARQSPEQVQFYQLYVNSDRAKTEQLVRKAEASGYRVLCITVDAPVLGRREKDMRHKYSSHGGARAQADDPMVSRNEGTSRALSSYIDPSLCWDDIRWFRSITTTMKIALKGIQCGEDAVLAFEHGVDAIIVSNHGGRQLDYARSGIEVLPEVMDALRAVGCTRRHMEVWVDGGFRRGTDVFKALALGATAVGIGRPVLYGMAAFGEAGVRRVLQLLQDELAMAMRLNGVTRIADIKREMVCVKNLADHVSTVPRDALMHHVYQPLATATQHHRHSRL